MSKPTRQHCAGTARTNEPCRRYGINNTLFCALHADLCGCTPEQLETAGFCSKCHVQFYTEDLTPLGEVYKQCMKCREFGENYRAAARERVEATLPEHICEFPKCKLRKLVLESEELDKYCKLHQRQNFIDETAALGLRMCANNIRGCRAQLEATYKRMRCPECLAKERKRENARRKGEEPETTDEPATPAPAQDAAPGVVTVLVAVPDIAVKRCTVCCKTQPVDQFISVKDETIITKLCATCRAGNKIQDAKRDRVRRNELERKRFKENPHAYEAKNRWRLHNRDKITEIWKAYRLRQRKLLGEEEYHRKAADSAKNWRDANPEKVQTQYQRNKDSREYQYRVYFRKAKSDGMEFAISFDEYVAIVNAPCAYCACTPPREFNGVDRVDNLYLHRILDCKKRNIYPKNTTHNKSRIFYYYFQNNQKAYY